jgi:hypothetical protein
MRADIVRSGFFFNGFVFTSTKQVTDAELRTVYGLVSDIACCSSVRSYAIK